jgi:hypothetical protein
VSIEAQRRVERGWLETMMSNGKEGHEEVNDANRGDVPAGSESGETRPPDAPCERDRTPYVTPKVTLVKDAKKIQRARKKWNSRGTEEVEG